MNTIEALRTLAQLESVEAVSLGDGDHVFGDVPRWAELMLTLIGEGGARVDLALSRHDAELVIEVLWSVLHPGEHRQSPVQRLWERLDDTVDYLMVDDPEPEDKARAKALAEAIALISLPFAEEPDIDSIRAQAAERWEQRDH